LSAGECARSFDRVTEFLVEMYVSQTDAGAVAHLAQCARIAAEELSGQGIPVRYVRSIFVPEEETCFIFYDALSADVAREAASRARLPFVCVAAALAAEPDAC
jgi:hypothetical protein